MTSTCRRCCTGALCAVLRADMLWRAVTCCGVPYYGCTVVNDANGAPGCPLFTAHSVPSSAAWPGWWATLQWRRGGTASTPAASCRCWCSALSRCWTESLRESIGLFGTPRCSMTDASLDVAESLQESRALWHASLPPIRRAITPCSSTPRGSSARQRRLSAGWLSAAGHVASAPLFRPARSRSLMMLCHTDCACRRDANAAASEALEATGHFAAGGCAGLSCVFACATGVL